MKKIILHSCGMLSGIIGIIIFVLAKKPNLFENTLFRFEIIVFSLSILFNFFRFY